MSATNLPSEIFCDIARLLSSKEQHTCLFVCRVWYSIIRQVIYRAVRITSGRQWTRFIYHALNASSLRDNPLGHLVRELRIENNHQLWVEINTRPALTGELPSLCPYLRVLLFPRILWPIFAPLNRWSQLERVPAFPELETCRSVLNAMGPQLTDLEFQLCDGETLGWIQALKYTPNVKSFVLDNIAIHGELTVDDMEMIHAHCPLLEDLSLKRIRLTMYDRDQLIRYPVAKRLKRVHFSSLTIDQHHWFFYLAHKYPFLENLEIRCNRIINPTVHYREMSCKALAILAESLAHLETLKLESIVVDHRFFKALGIVHPKLSVMEVVPFWSKVHDSVVEETLDALWNCVRILAPRAVKAPIWQRNRLDFSLKIAKYLGPCRYLTSLSLLSTSNHAPRRNTFELDPILYHCQSLTRLVIKFATVAISTQSRYHQPHDSLKRLELNVAFWNPDMFDFLSRYCPRLQELSLNLVARIGLHEQPAIEISLPNHDLTLLDIHDISRMDMTDTWLANATILSISQLKNRNTKRTWHHLCNHNNCCLHPNYNDPYHLRELNAEDIQLVKQYHPYCSDPPPNVSRDSFNYDKEPWETDIPYGYVSILCHSVREFKFHDIKYPLKH
ncbi:hypothetical protein EC973_008739 [Apophysomyces ossiformis]|uniref:F-box domain-containing protein n=1 Tax=Apophysomyces ossiformis TaxID=679940 RepID=A0A8H7EQQ9_9FUNG|nr:hypothetical protein EC973_008739 [Apophysomyces ossiformis]